MHVAFHIYYVATLKWIVKKNGHSFCVWSLRVRVANYMYYTLHE